MRSSSVIVLTRGHGADLEVFWSQRRHDLAFLGGFHAFAGGSVEPGDEAMPLTRAPHPDEPPRAAFGCAARELFEEMGLLVTDTGLGFVEGFGDLDLRRLRADLVDGQADLAGALRDHGLRIPVDRLLPLGRWRTPEFFEIRFDTEFFALQLSDEELSGFGQRRLVDHLLDKELLGGEWIRPDDALQRWLSGLAYITPPIRYLLEALRDVDDPREVHIDHDVARDVSAWLSSGGVYLVPLKTPTLPPATHTNCLIVGDDELVVIDPGSPDPGEQALLFDLLDQLRAEGRSLRATVLTHHHPDHVGGAASLAQRFDVPVWAHRRTAEHLAGELEIDRLLADGDTIELGRDSLTVLHTPGHASGHVCLHHARTDAVIAGDLVAARGTILVNPPDGHMGDYLESLARIRDLAPRALYPAHGWIITDPVDRLQHYIDHRLGREEKVHRALLDHDGPATPMDLVPQAYDDAPQAVWPLAARSAQAHLDHLVELGRARNEGPRYVATTPGLVGASDF